MSNSDTIHFIMTGGTIDSYYDGTKDTAVPKEHSVLPNFIAGLKLHIPTVFTEVCMKDSRSITKNDLEEVKKTIETSGSTKIIVTHGTFTMGDTSRYLEANLTRKDQTVIFTGSFIPLDGFTFSDAGFNLGFAISKLNELSAGVYICMNGRVFKPAEVLKNLQEGKFVSLLGER